MALDALVRPLLDISIFRGLKPLQLTEIARRAERTVYHPGQILIEENAEADAAIVIVSGDCLRVSGPDLQSRAEPVAAGSLLAELAMLIETQHSSTIVARTDVRALRLVRTDMHEIMAADPDLADHFVTKIAGRLHEMHATLLGIYDGLDNAGTAAWPRLATTTTQLPMQH